MSTGTVERGGERVLVVDDDPLTLQCLTDTVEMMELSVSQATDGDDAIRVFERDHPEVVVTDVRLPHRDGLALTAYIKSHQPQCPVIIITGYGDEETAVAALKAGATDYLSKPFQLTDFKTAIRRALGDIEGRMMEPLSFRALDQHFVQFVMKNEPHLIGDLVSYLLRPINEYLMPTEQLHVRVTLQELLINAVEHGNLGISHEEKTEALRMNGYQQLLDARRAKPSCRARRVHVTLFHDCHRREISCRITDEGEGFLWQPMVGSGPEGEAPMGGSGRGIFLAKRLMPTLRYHGCGNEVSFIFRYTGNSSDDMSPA